MQKHALPCPAIAAAAAPRPSSWLSAVIDDPTPGSAKDAQQAFPIIFYIISTIYKKSFGSPGSKMSVYFQTEGVVLMFEICDE